MYSPGFVKYTYCDFISSHFPQTLSLSSVTCLSFFQLLQSSFTVFLCNSPTLIYSSPCVITTCKIGPGRGGLWVWDRWPGIPKMYLLSERIVEVNGPFGKCPKGEGLAEWGAHLMLALSVCCPSSARTTRGREGRKEKDKERKKGLPPYISDPNKFQLKSLMG